MKKNKDDKAAGYAYRLLSIRPRSEKELRGRLFKKGFGQAVVCEVISSLKDKKIIDDLKFSRLWIESRMRTSPKGDMLLRKELAGKGVAPLTIDKALSEKSGNEGVVVATLAQKKIKSLEKLPKPEAKRKLFSFLARRGFSFGVIEEVIRENLGA
ncbi:MAG: regulatory protein RecX [Candidatus Omnitrophica bacterium]|nr:regulatory protein RecX [Candidatus Omnitrophota bacterium]